MNLHLDPDLDTMCARCGRLFMQDLSRGGAPRRYCRACAPEKPYRLRERLLLGPKRVRECLVCGGRIVTLRVGRPRLYCDHCAPIDHAQDRVGQPSPSTNQRTRRNGRNRS